jgi:ABC-type uncharacterized transport system YnjBCD ATPase subunit
VTLELKNVTKTVGQAVHIADASLNLQRGTLNVLLGPTLSGKTTLMRLMAGLDRPTKGRVLFDGKDVTGLPVQKRNVAMVYQQFINYPSLTVYENIASPLRVARTPKPEIDRRVRKVAEFMHLTPMLQRLPLELSGGQQQRVALARGQKEFPQHYPPRAGSSTIPKTSGRASCLDRARGAAQGEADGADIAAIGITNQRETALIWEKRDRQADPQRHRLAGPAHGRDVREAEEGGARAALRAGDRAPARSLFLGHEIRLDARQGEGRAAARGKGELLAGTVDSFLIWRLTGGKSGMSPTRPTPRERCSTTSRKIAGTRSCSTSWASRKPCCRR